MYKKKTTYYSNKGNKENKIFEGKFEEVEDTEKRKK